jgi:hypothetical protein
MIAPPRSLHEVSLHHAPQGSSRLERPGSLSMARPGMATVPFPGSRPGRSATMRG